MEITPDELADYFDFLDGLRESRAVNMFGARPYLAKEFELDDKKAAAVLSKWMRSFDADVSPLEQAQQAITL